MKRTRIKPRSDKRASEDQERKRVALETFGESPNCGACLMLVEVGVFPAQTGCNGRATEVHEPLTRARGGSITDPANMVPLSRECHRWLHAHPLIATDAGLLRNA